MKFAGVLLIIVGLCALPAGGAVASAQPSPANAPANPPIPITAANPTSPSVIDPRTYGAKADGITYDTAAIQRAIDACAGTGKTVYLAHGKFLSAELTLKGNMTFYVDKSATLLGGQEPADYPTLVPEQTLATGNRRSLLYADHADGLILDGTGVIDGQGKRVKLSGREALRPSILRIFHSDNVIVRNITLANPRMWTQVYSECNQLVIDHITVLAPNGVNLDGIDICDCHDVILRNSHFDSEDDSICLKSYGLPGLKDILIENNTVISSEADGIKLGTATAGPISNIRLLNNTVLAAKLGGLCIESIDGSAISDIVVDGLNIYRSPQPIFIRIQHRLVGPGELLTRPTADVPQGSIDGVAIRKLRALDITGPRSSCTISGLPGAQPTNITFSDCYLEMPGGAKAIPADPGDRPNVYPQSDLFGITPSWGFYIRHAHGINFDNLSIARTNPDPRPWLATLDADVKTTDLHELNQITPTSVPSPPATAKSDGQ